MSGYITSNDLQELDLVTHRTKPSTTTSTSSSTYCPNLSFSDSPSSPPEPPNTSNSSGTTPPRRTRRRTTTRVAFLDEAKFILVAEPGEIELSMLASYERDQQQQQRQRRSGGGTTLGRILILPRRPTIGLKTYSLGTSPPKTAKRAWECVRNGLSQTLEPLLSPDYDASNSCRTRRESSPEREREQRNAYKCPAALMRSDRFKNNCHDSSDHPSLNRMMRRASIGYSDDDDDDDDDEDDDEESGGIGGPAGGRATKLTLRIPTLTTTTMTRRRRDSSGLDPESPSPTTTTTTRSILRRVSSRESSPAPASPPRFEQQPRRRRPTDSSFFFPPLVHRDLTSLDSASHAPNRSQEGDRDVDTSTNATARFVPVVDCCRACGSATDYGWCESDGDDDATTASDPEDDDEHEQSRTDRGKENETTRTRTRTRYVERWSRGAKRLRDEQGRNEGRRQRLVEGQGSTLGPARDANDDSGGATPRAAVETVTMQEYEDAPEAGWELVDDGEGDGEDGNKDGDGQDGVTGNRLGARAKGVDELELNRDRRHVKTISEKEHDDGAESSPTSPASTLSSASSHELGRDRHDETGTLELVTTSTPPTSPDMSPPLGTPVRDAAVQASDDRKIPFPTMVRHKSAPEPSTRHPNTNSTTPTRPTLATSTLKRGRTLSFSQKVASFGSSFFGGGGASIAHVTPRQGALPLI